MKKIHIFLLFISISNFAQNNNNFSLENKSIEWSYVFELKPGENISLLKDNLILDFKNDNFGISKNQTISCSGISIYSRLPFNFNFRIESKDDKYRVVVSNIIFNDNLNFGNSTTTKLEMYALKNDSEIKQNGQNNKNLNCLNEYFLNIFKIKSPKSNW
ncbi:hypothetical protein [Flavobacterium sp. CSZ]|uniref:hypothetical protein n=1 Tax=Flavobacterium sp. CSZ TaxID=2783791 RepID=UPI00188C204B|nr:hypothetical protein [Flavobacterium sp. CSZ]MBF4484400.1 hypothetical protein [Flavobacterium sp. CSZ]